MRRWSLVGLAGIGIALLALGTVRSPWRGRAGGAGLEVPIRIAAREAPDVLAPEANEPPAGALGLAIVAGLRALGCRRHVC